MPLEDPFSGWAKCCSNRSVIVRIDRSQVSSDIRRDEQAGAGKSRPGQCQRQVTQSILAILAIHEIRTETSGIDKVPAKRTRWCTCCAYGAPGESASVPSVAGRDRDVGYCAVIRRFPSVRNLKMSAAAINAAASMRAGIRVGDFVGAFNKRSGSAHCPALLASQDLFPRFISGGYFRTSGICKLVGRFCSVSKPRPSILRAPRTAGRL